MRLIWKTSVLLSYGDDCANMIWHRRNLNFWYNACGITKFQNKYFNISNHLPLYTQINMLTHKMVLKHLLTHSWNCCHLFYYLLWKWFTLFKTSSFVTLFNKTIICLFIRFIHLGKCNSVKSYKVFSIFVVYCSMWRSHSPKYTHTHTPERAYHTY